MQEFLLLIHGIRYKDESPNALKQHVEKYESWVKSLQENDQYICGNRLDKSGNVIIDRNTVISDGPFIETKEIIGGYILIRANDINEATQLAIKCPLSEEFEIQVRPMYVWPEIK